MFFSFIEKSAKKIRNQSGQSWDKESISQAIGKAQERLKVSHPTLEILNSPEMVQRLIARNMAIKAMDEEARLFERFMIRCTQSKAI